MFQNLKSYGKWFLLFNLENLKKPQKRDLIPVYVYIFFLDKLNKFNLDNFYSGKLKMHDFNLWNIVDHKREFYVCSENYSSALGFCKVEPWATMWPLDIGSLFIILPQTFDQSKSNGIYLNNLASHLFDKSASVFISCRQHGHINARLKQRWLD